MVHGFRLELPERARKPRSVGLTHVLDKGLPLAQVADVLATGADYVDVWKFGWGTAYVDPALEAKVDLLGRYGVLACIGGTLLEVAWTQERTADYLAWAAAVGVPCVEVSRGAAPMSVGDKHTLIRRASADFVVVSEVGRKDEAEALPPADWAEEVAGDLRAGARWVLAEGRESGTVGIYDDRGRVREDVVAAIAGAGGVERIVFEAPSKDQQAWFIQQFGPGVNLANIAPAEVLGLETLRLGLRADTMHLSCPTGVPALSEHRSSAEERSSRPELSEHRSSAEERSSRPAVIGAPSEIVHQ